jgi:lipopolysaccharide/colanic/teichoic acid biosynthesis glycosyltransferase
MSLFGPRPTLAREVSDLLGRVVFRFAVTQGVTGPWQPHGYHRLTFDEQLSVEHMHIQSCSLRKDVAILLQIFRVVLLRCGA